MEIIVGAFFVFLSALLICIFVWLGISNGYSEIAVRVSLSGVELRLRR